MTYDMIIHILLCSNYDSIIRLCFYSNLLILIYVFDVYIYLVINLIKYINNINNACLNKTTVPTPPRGYLRSKIINNYLLMSNNIILL